MASTARFKKQVPTDIWCVRERLSLASSVMRSGDQNWVSVSRAIRPFGEPNRPPDWFSQKNCALQYSDLLEKVETPKRKRSERGETETPGDQIARKLTIERIEELKRIVQEEQQKYKKLKRDIEMVRAGQLDDRLSETLDELQSQKKGVEDAEDTEDESQARAAALARVVSKPVVAPTKPKRLQPGLKLLMDDPTNPSILNTDSIKIEDTSSSGQASTPSQVPTKNKPKPACVMAPSSPLLSSLLQNHPDRQGLTTQPGQVVQTQVLKTQTQAPPGCTEQSQTACQCQPAVPSQTGIKTEQTIPLSLPTIEIKEEPIDSDVTITTTPEPDTSLPQPSTPVETSPVATPMASTVATVSTSVTSSPVTSSSAHTTLVKLEVPSSPSAGAPTLSRLLVIPPPSGTAPVKLSAMTGTAPVKVSAMTGTAPVKVSVRTGTAPVKVSATAGTSPVKVSATAGTSPVKVSATAGTAPVKVSATAGTAPVTLSATSGTAPVKLSSTKNVGPSGCADAKPTKPKMTQDVKVDVSKTTTPEPVVTPTTPTAPRREATSGKQDHSLPSEGVIETLKHTPSSIMDDDPASPASSIVSNETDSGSAKGIRSCAKRSRGRGKGRRVSHRLTRCRVEEDKAASSGKPSEAESSDDEGCQAESDDCTSAITAKTSLSISESIPNSPASLSQCSDTEDEKAYKVWKKSIMLVWRAAANHKYANVFLHPVTNEIAPGYLGIVYRPMDLSAIKKNIETGALRTTAEFQRDMMLMFTNAIMYNNSDHDVYNMAVEMYNDVMIHIEQYVNTQMMVQSETKILRQSRRSEAGTSDKEDDFKKRKPSTENEHGGKSKKRK